MYMVGERKSALVLISTKRSSERTHSFTQFCSMTTMASDSLKTFLFLSLSLDLALFISLLLCLLLSLMDIDLVLGTYSRFLSIVPVVSC